MECSPSLPTFFEAIANPNNGFIELRVASQVLYKKAYVAWLLQNNCITPDTISNLLEAIANPSNGLIELSVTSQILESLYYYVVVKQPHFSRHYCRPL